MRDTELYAQILGVKRPWRVSGVKLELEGGDKALKTSRAWMLKELAREMWQARDRHSARQIFAAWYSWAIRSRLEPVKRVARVTHSNS